MPIDRPTLPAGTLLDGKWLIESHLDDGGTASVYAAVHARNGLPVAVKILHPELAFDADQRKRFIQEGYAANRVGNDGVVRVLDDGATADGGIYLVMERLEGGTLTDLADQHGGTLPLDAFAGIGKKMLEVIAAAHTARIVHRDLKPENVFICDDGSVKILDFGLARVHESKGARITTNNVGSMGTPAFMPPEQALGHWDEVDARSDVYSLGATFFTILTGKLVHDGRTIQELIVRTCTAPARPMRSVAPNMPEAAARVIDRALAFRRADRFADATDMLHAWIAATAQFSGGILSLRRGEPSPRSAPGVSMRDTGMPVTTGSRAVVSPKGLKVFLATFCVTLVLTASIGAFVISRTSPAGAKTPAAATTEITPITPIASPPIQETASATPTSPAASNPVVSAIEATATATASASVSASAKASSSKRSSPPVRRGRGPCVIDPFTKRCRT